VIWEKDGALVVYDAATFAEVKRIVAGAPRVDGRFVPSMPPISWSIRCSGRRDAATDLVAAIIRRSLHDVGRGASQRSLDSISGNHCLQGTPRSR
jgi:hypothetical protein